MARSLYFDKSIQDLIPVEILEKHRLMPISIHQKKMCVISRRPLSKEALSDLKQCTGLVDYEVQLVGEDVIDEYLILFRSKALFTENNL